MKIGPKVALVSCAVTLLAAYGFMYGSDLYPNATLGWMGQHSRFPGYAFVNYHGTNYVWVCLGVGLIAFTLYSMWLTATKKRRRRSNRPPERGVP